jgi:sulfate adenylyltransferase subunit 2
MTIHYLTHLKQLEAEDIHIIREVAAEFEKPLMSYLVMKAFYPAKLPFSLWQPKNAQTR